ncbi:GTPase [Helicobacter sp. MIT 14-3879]|uniref:GTPase n=1 Tax=Helicobacter sp. MIT 14-3879 TaxID=2040649 RepID=UPI0015F16623|nr:GTPase [Helicobacter sp. MIT 14-3879]
MCKLTPKKYNEYKEDMEELYSLFEKHNSNSSFRVTCLGIYNSGKSSLLNALSESYDNSYFKVADIRETKEIKAIDIDGFCYVDTPGLNATESDDKTTYEAAKESDINLFVHNINTGDFNQPEREFLEPCALNWGDNERFLQSTIFVLSRQDEVDDEERQIQIVKEKIQEQIKSIFGATTQPYIISVSAKTYCRGKEKGSSQLIEKSNIPELQELILSMKEEIAKIRGQRIEKKHRTICEKIERRIQALQKERQKIIKEKETMQRKMDEHIRLINETLQTFNERNFADVYQMYNWIFRN